MDETYAFVVYARAVDSTGDACAQIKAEYSKDPTQENLEALRDMATEAYEYGFEEKPARVGVAKLPWAADYDTTEKN